MLSLRDVAAAGAAFHPGGWEEKPKCICFLQKKVIACLQKPDQENYRYVGVGGMASLVWCTAGSSLAASSSEAAHVREMWQPCWGW